jgi:hypothetical protein
MDDFTIEVISDEKDVKDVKSNPTDEDDADEEYTTISIDDLVSAHLNQEVKKEAQRLSDKQEALAKNRQAIPATTITVQGSWIGPLDAHRLRLWQRQPTESKELAAAVQRRCLESVVKPHFQRAATQVKSQAVILLEEALEEGFFGPLITDVMDFKAELCEFTNQLLRKTDERLKALQFNTTHTIKALQQAGRSADGMWNATDDSCQERAAHAVQILKSANILPDAKITAYPFFGQRSNDAPKLLNRILSFLWQDEAFTGLARASLSWFRFMYSDAATQLRSWRFKLQDDSPEERAAIQCCLLRAVPHLTPQKLRLHLPLSDEFKMPLFLRKSAQTVDCLEICLPTAVSFCLWIAKCFRPDDYVVAPNDSKRKTVVYCGHFIGGKPELELVKTPLPTRQSSVLGRLTVITQNGYKKNVELEKWLQSLNVARDIVIC